MLPSLWTGDTSASLLQSIELKTYDWRMRRTARPETARTDIALVEIDEYSLRNAEGLFGRWPWPRVAHSMIVDFLMRGPAKVVGYDVLLVQPDTHSFDIDGTTWTGKESDSALVESIKAAGDRFVLLADATFEGKADKDGAVSPLPDLGFRIDPRGALHRDLIFLPFEALAREGKAFGHNFFVFDSDGPLRHSVPFVTMNDRAIPSLGLATAIRAEGVNPSSVTIDGDLLRIGTHAVPLSWRRVTNANGESRYQWELVRFRGPALLPDLVTRPYASYRASDLLKAENELLNGQKPSIDPALFKDKIVFVGATAAGLFDVFETPFAQTRMPGIQVHASVADDVLSSRFMSPINATTTLAVVIVLALGAAVASTLLPAWWAAALVVVVDVVFVWIATALFARGYWLNVTAPTVATALSLFGGVGYQFFFEGREKRKMKKLFGQYVSKDIYDQLVAHPEMARLGGQRREMTVLFSDIRGFTTVTERGQPEEIVGMLNEYFTRMVDIVFAHQGTLDKFVGDMVMALFGAPVDDPQHAEHAVQAALAMTAELAKLNEKWKSEGRFSELDIGIGINTGPMIAGNIGSEAVMSYTVIGDAVNLGARLESLNKQYGTRIIISDATRGQLSGRYDLRPLGDVVVKGKTQPVAIFEVVKPEGV
jgi:adenylate cyclase